MGIENIWATDKIPKFNSFKGNMFAEAVIIGGGLSGLSVAYYLACQGIKCIVLEEGEVLKKLSEISTGTANVLNGFKYFDLNKKQGPEPGRRVAESYLYSLNELRKICSLEVISCDFKQVRNFLYLNNPKNLQRLKDELDLIQIYGIKAELEENGVLPVTYTSAIVVEEQVILNPIKFISGLVHSLNKKGVLIFEDSKVTKISNNCVFTGNGLIKTSNIIITGNDERLPDEINKKIIPDETFITTYKNVPESEGIYVSADKPGYLFRFSEGEMLFCGKEKDELARFVQELFPGSEKISESNVKIFDTKDGLPIIGKMGELYVATAMGKYGIFNSILAGGIITDLILGKENQYVNLFKPDR